MEAAWVRARRPLSPGGEPAMYRARRRAEHWQRVQVDRKSMARLHFEKRRNATGSGLEEERLIPTDAVQIKLGLPS